MTDTAHQHLNQMLERVEQVQEWAYNALATVAEAEMRELAKRFPTRRIELHSGMGVTQLRIDKRHPRSSFDDWHWSNDVDDRDQDWPTLIAEPMPDFWTAVQLFADVVIDGKDPGFGTIIYENGKRIKGTPAGGEVRD